MDGLRKRDRRRTPGATYPLTDSSFAPDDAAGLLMDGTKEDIPFLPVFLYLALPYEGFEHLPRLKRNPSSRRGPARRSPAQSPTIGAEVLKRPYIQSCLGGGTAEALEGGSSEFVSRFAAVLETPDVRREIERLARAQGFEGPMEGMRLAALKAHRHRCTFEAAFGPEDHSPRIILKVYDRDRSDVLVAMESMIAAGFGPTAEFAIPRPFGYLSSAHVLVQERVTGTRAIDIFMRGAPEAQIEAAQRCGAWLGQFHTKAPRQGRATHLDEFLQGIRYWGQAVGGAGEPLSSKADLLLRKLEAAIPSAGNGSEPAAAHGSYMPEHVILSGARTVTIDVDEYEITDPARDLSWFILSLQRLGLDQRGSLRVYDRPIEAFLRAYVTLGPRDALSPLSFYKAGWCLYRANRYLFYRDPPIPERSERMLDEGIASLGFDRGNRNGPPMSPRKPGPN